MCFSPALPQRPGSRFLSHAGFGTCSTVFFAMTSLWWRRHCFLISSDFTLEAFEKSRYLIISHGCFTSRVRGFGEPWFSRAATICCRCFNSQDVIPFRMARFFGSQQPGVPRISMDLKAIGPLTVSSSMISLDHQSHFFHLNCPVPKIYQNMTNSLYSLMIVVVARILGSSDSCWKEAWFLWFCGSHEVIFYSENTPETPVLWGSSGGFELGVSPRWSLDGLFISWKMPSINRYGDHMWGFP